MAIPGEEDDYVDQFLFDTKTGYCDNFSSAMVVLLRSIGIPARWVKGYNSGTVIGKSENDTLIYEIRNNNAHSWVEVYFPGFGWVPLNRRKGILIRPNSLPILPVDTTAYNRQTPEPSSDEHQEQPDGIQGTKQGGR